MKDFFKNILISVKSYLKRLSFKTGILFLGLCIIFYILSFAQMALNLTYSVKGVLWVIFFGLAKTFQYAGLAVIGVEGIKRLKLWFTKSRNKDIA